MAEPKRPGGAPLVRVVVPNRVDIAGGTLDIFPLYLLVPGSMTVNAAIDVASVVSIHPVRGAVRLVSENLSRRPEPRDTHGFPVRGGFGLVAAALRCFPPRSGIELRFRNEAPIGSGIGASSALLVATVLAMSRLLGMRKSWRETAREAMEIEAAHLRNLTGSQDHIAALRGGIQGIRYLPGRRGDGERVGDPQDDRAGHLHEGGGRRVLLPRIPEAGGGGEALRRGRGRDGVRVASGAGGPGSGGVVPQGPGHLSASVPGLRGPANHVLGRNRCPLNLFPSGMSSSWGQGPPVFSPPGRWPGSCAFSSWRRRAAPAGAGR